MKTTIYDARMLQESDYETLVKWWEFWRFPAPQRNFLPDNATCGIILEDVEGVQYCAGFLYFTNSDACWLEFVVSNPDIKDKKVRKEMLNDLIKNLCYLAEAYGAKWVFTSVKNKSLLDRYSDNGFLVGTQAATEMIKQL